MVKALESNQDIPVSGLQSINLDESVVYFRDDCLGVFLRKNTDHQKGFVGPAAPLVLDHIECGAQNP